jgi:fucose 4-O-acetylase-like acetyltransferase
MTDIEKSTITNRRIYWLDNLRMFVIFLVVICHAGWIYESSGIGAYFWIVDDPSTNDLCGIMNIVLDIFMMPTMFFIAGFFTSFSLKNKKGWAFLKSKFKRLMLPWIIAVLTLMPLYKVIFLYSRNMPQESWTTYFHWSNGILSQSWLWFLPVLFLFDVLYLIFSKVKVGLSNISLKGAVFIIFIIGFIYSFCMSIFNLGGWTKTVLIDFQNEKLLIYFMIFLLGSLCFKLKIFESKPAGKKFYITMICTSWIPIDIYVFLIIYSFVKPGEFIFSQIVDRIIIIFSFHLSLLSLLYLMVETFRRYLNKWGKIMMELNRNSYYVYIIHVVVLGGIALIMLNTAVPSLLKYLILAVSTYVTCNLIISIYRKIIEKCGFV